MSKNKKKLIVLLVVVFAILIFVNLKKEQDPQLKVAEEVSPYLDSNIEIKTFEGEKGWGYDIYIDGTQYVHQPNIPALPGDAGFETEAEAKAVAELMVEKIRKNILPPGVTEEEVKAIIDSK